MWGVQGFEVKGHLEVILAEKGHFGVKWTKRFSHRLNWMIVIVDQFYHWFRYMRGVQEFEVKGHLGVGYGHFAENC